MSSSTTLTVRRRRILAAAVAAAAALGVAWPAASPGVTRTWTNGNGDSQWSTVANWSAISPSHEPNNSEDVVFPSTVPLSSFFITLSSGEQARSLALNNFYHLQSGSLTLATASVSVASGFNGFVTSVLAGTAGLTITGGGRLDLSGVNTFTGNVTVSSNSTLAVDADSRLGNAANAVFLNGGQLITQSSMTMSRSLSVGPALGTIQQVGGTTLTLNGNLQGLGQLDVNGFGTLALNATGFRAAFTTIENGTVRLNNGLGLGTDALNISNGGRLEISAGVIHDSSSAINITLGPNGTIRTGGAGAVEGGFVSVSGGSGSSVFIDAGDSASATLQLDSYSNGTGVKTVVIGLGTVTLPGSNTYAGDWQIDGGTLRITNATALGSGSSAVVVNNGGTLDVAAVLDRAVDLNSGGTLKFEGLAQSNGVHTIPSAAAVGFALKALGASASLGNAANDLTGGDSASTITVSSDTAGNVLALSQSNDYAGNWTINGNATVRITNATALGAGTSAVTLNNGGVLEIGGISFGRNVSMINGSTLRGTGAAAATGTVIAPGGPNNHTATISTGTNPSDVFTLGDSTNDLTGGGNTTNIIIGGAGKVVLTQSSDYVGNWSVVAGSTLEISADDQLGAAGNVVSFGGVVSTTASFTSARTWRTSDGTLSTALGTTLTLNGLLGGGSGAGTFTKAGAGTLQLNASTTRTSASTLNAGTVRLTGSVNGLGSGTASVNNTATLELAAASITDGGIRLNDGGTLKGTGISSYSQGGFPEITNGPADVNITVAGASDRLTIGSAIRSVSASASSSTIHVNGAGRLILSSGGTNATDIFGGIWVQSDGILQVAQGGGSAINALGFKNGDATQANTIAVNGGTLAVGGLGSGAGTPPWLRANLVIAGGAIASTNGVDAQYGGNFVVLADTSRVLLFDPVSPSTARSVNLVAGEFGADHLNASTIWTSDSILTVDPGTTTGGAFNITRDGGTVIVIGNATLQINPGATVNLGGSGDALSDGDHHVNVVNNSTTSFNVSVSVKNVGDLDGVGNTNVNSATLIANRVRQNALTINGGAVLIRPNGGAGGTSRVLTLSVSVGSKLNLQDNKLITQSPVGSFNGSAYTDVTGLIQSGRNGGGWAGTGIVTSQSSATTSNFTSIGIATAAQVKGIAATATSVFAGQTVTGSDTLVMYTYGGDANLDGKLNVDDYGHIDSSIPIGLTGWFNGDFNYDGKINVDDYGIIDFNIGIQGAPFSTTSDTISAAIAVPEPGAAGLAFAAACSSSLLRRRRRGLN